VRSLFAVLALLALVLTGVVAAQPPAKPPLRIAVVPKGTTHEFWRSVHAGAIKAERELGGVKITFRGPQKEDDREQQQVRRDRAGAAG
jgi:ABC-type sugar transport system substrate-binding protein